jgi:hypothetical protein
MTNISEAPDFVHNPHAPDVFADAATGFFLFNGSLRVTFESLRVDHTTSPGPLTRLVIGRLVMPAAAAETMAKEILSFLERMKAQQVPMAQATSETKH